MSNGGSSFSGSQYQPSYQNPLARNPYNTNPNTNQAMPYGALGMPSMGMSQPYGSYGMNAMSRPDAGQFQQRMMFNYMPQAQSKMGYAGRYTMDSTRPPIDKPPPPPGSQTPPPGYQPAPTPTPPPVVPTPTPSPTPSPTPFVPDPNPVPTAVGPWGQSQGYVGGIPASMAMMLGGAGQPPNMDMSYMYNPTTKQWVKP